MPATMTKPTESERDELMAPKRPRVPIEISFPESDLSKPRFEKLIDYKLKFDPDLVQPGFMASVRDFEIDLRIKENAEEQRLRFSRDPMGLPRLQWGVNPNPLDMPLRGTRLRDRDRWCTLFWGEPKSNPINASVLAFYVLEYRKLLLKAIPLGIGYIHPSMREAETERLAAGENPPAIGSSVFGPADLTLNAKLRNGRLVYDLFHYRSWSGIEPEPFLRIKKFPFTMRFVAHGFQFEPDKERQGKRRPIKPAIDWYDPVSKRVLGEQPKKIQVGDLNNKRTEFAVTFESRSVLITSFFARTSEEGVLFDPTVSEDADEDTGPGAVFY